MTIDENARYLESHEWARKEGNLFTIGISDHAQSLLSDIVYVELPEIDDELEKGELFGVVESVKAASDVYLPLSGTVIEVNEELLDAPELINEDALYDAIQSGRLSGAALDVFSKQPPDAENPLFSLPQILATPHIGSHTDGATNTMGWRALNDCLAVLRGEEPRYRVV